MSAGPCVVPGQRPRRDGYVQRRVDGKLIYAHRWAWTEAYGSIPAGLCVCHACDNRACINVAHLFLGSPADNTRDMVAKGRARGPAKLAVADVVAIRAAAVGGPAQGVIARRYGISRSTVNAILRGRRWRQVA